MMKRSNLVHTFITIVLGLTAGSFISLAVSLSSIYCGVLAMLAAAALVLHAICGAYEESNSNNDEE